MDLLILLVLLISATTGQDQVTMEEFECIQNQSLTEHGLYYCPMDFVLEIELDVCELLMIPAVAVMAKS